METIKIISTLRNLSKDELQAMTYPDYFRRGLDYYYGGTIVSPKLYPPNKLTAFVKGNYRPKYKVEIKAVDEDIKANCTCPTGIEYCKHVIATLLLWIDSPNKFEIAKNDGVRAVGEQQDQNFIQEAKIQTILMSWNKNDLIQKIIAVLKKANYFNDEIFMVKFLNYDKECKLGVSRKAVQYKNSIPEIMARIKGAIKELNDFYENYGFPDEWYYKDSEGYSEEEEDLLEDFESSIEELNQINKFIQVLFDFGLEEEANQLYDLLEASLEKILDTEIEPDYSTVEILEESQQKEFDDNKDSEVELEDIEGYEDDYEEEDEFQYEFVDLDELKQFRENLRQNYLVKSFNRYDHKTKLKKLIDLFERNPSNTLKQAIVDTFTIEDYSVIQAQLARSSYKSSDLFELTIKLLTEAGEEEKIINLCKQLLNKSYCEKVYEKLVIMLSKRDIQNAIRYCQEALKKNLNKNFFSERLVDLYLKTNLKKKALTLLTDHYIENMNKRLYFKLKDLAIELDQWEKVSQKIVEQAKKNKLFRNLLYFFRLEARFKDAVSLIQNHDFEKYDIIQITEDCTHLKLYPEALILYKKVIRQLFYSGKGLIGIKQLTNKYGKLYRFRTEFLLKLQ
ncbi:MAG: SWIM zinc finger family protein [Candidatus Helarchaeota archaeon]